ncbi:hypothetical protein VPHD479_0375 [Vibrio phage D479]
MFQTCISSLRAFFQIGGETETRTLTTLLTSNGFQGRGSTNYAYLSRIWCAGWDSNPHALRPRNLNPRCLPIPAPAHVISTPDNRTYFDLFQRLTY